jgi:hypothetical protein
MAIEEFWSNLRGAAGWLVRTMPEDPAHADAATLERMFQYARMWLTPRSVEGFDPDEFAFLPDEHRAALQESVERFRSVVDRMPRKKPPKRELLEEGRVALRAILDLIHLLEFVDAESFRTTVLLERELRGRLPHWVTGISCRSGLDLADDPAIWIQVDVTDAAVDKKLIAKHWQKINDEIESAYRRIGGRRWVFYRYHSLDAFAHQQGESA